MLLPLFCHGLDSKFDFLNRNQLECMIRILGQRWVSQERYVMYPLLETICKEVLRQCHTLGGKTPSAHVQTSSGVFAYPFSNTVTLLNHILRLESLKWDHDGHHDAMMHALGKPCLSEESRFDLCVHAICLLCHSLAMPGNVSVDQLVLTLLLGYRSEVEPHRSHLEEACRINDTFMRESLEKKLRLNA